jgi:hypothetical protein
MDNRMAAPGLEVTELIVELFPSCPEELNPAVCIVPSLDKNPEKRLPV